jgi:hypothetical protein
MMPTEPGAPETGRQTGTEGADLPGPPVPPPPEYHWYHKMAAVLLITFCLEMGLFLLVFPWTEYWDNNLRSFFTALAPALRPFWDNMYIRGAISGLGVINLYISLVEVFRLRRFAKRQ